MKPHPKLGKSIKWLGAAATLLLSIILAASLLAPHRWQQTTNEVRALEPGYFAFEWSQPTYGTHRLWRSDFFRSMWPTFYDGPRGSWITIPLVGPTVLALCITVVAWRLDLIARRRATLNLCPNCNYNRTGLLQRATCPKCGTVSTTR